MSGRERGLCVSESREPSGAAVGWTLFAACMMMLVGGYHAIIGLAGILNDEVYGAVPALGTPQAGDAYFLTMDVTTWGWIHLIVGVILLLAGFGLFSGNVVARTVGVIAAILSAIGAFAWMPWAPIWGLAIIAADITVIWALTAHGRDVTMR